MKSDHTPEFEKTYTFTVVAVSGGVTSEPASISWTMPSVIDEDYNTADEDEITTEDDSAIDELESSGYNYRTDQNYENTKAKNAGIVYPAFFGCLGCINSLFSKNN